MRSLQSLGDMDRPIEYALTEARLEAVWGSNINLAAKDRLKMVLQGK